MGREPLTPRIVFAKISDMEEFFNSLPKELTDEERLFTEKFKKLFQAVSNEDMMRWAIFHIDWKIPYPNFPVFDAAKVPQGTDPTVAEVGWRKKEQSLKAKLWKRMFTGDEGILELGPVED